jgi:hypothetical protein
VRSVYQLLQVVWEAVSTAGRKEAVDLVAKAGIVRMLHDGHQLYSVVSQMLNAWENVVRELLVGSDSWLWGRDSDVCFVDTGALGLRWSLVLPYVLVGRVPEARIVDGRDTELLGYAGDPGWKALLARVVIGYDKGYLGTLCQFPSSPSV